jgi:L-alanine-DL-glutamate epimerase-like enolase superfamily enzyme
VRAIADIDTYVEQPCATTTELAQVRSGCSHPFVIDEAAKQPHDLIDAVALGCVEAMNLKPARVGGLTKACCMRDIAQAAGLRMTVDDPMGWNLTTAGIAHLATSVDPRHFLGVSFFGSHEAHPSDADNAPRFQDGRVSVPSGPGLGFVPGPDYLGEPLFSVASTYSVANRLRCRHA